MKFLGRAKKFLQDLGTESAAKAQYFNVTCASGHRVRGERTEGYQALRCPACGEGVFVLPRSPLPEPAVPAGAAESRGSQARARSPWADDGPVELTDPVQGTVELEDDGTGRDGAEIVWDDEPAEVSTRRGAPASPQVAPEDLAAAEIDATRRTQKPAANGEHPRSGATGQAASQGAGTRPARGPAGGRGAARPDGPRRGPVAGPQSAPAALEVRPRSRRGPRVGLIFFLLTLVVVAALGSRAWMQRRAHFPQIIERGRTEGIRALDSGDFDNAFQLLSAARSAVDDLGGAVEDAEEIRRAAAEAAIFVDLCPERLENMLAEVGRIDPDEWESKFDALYKGRTYLFDTFIKSTPSTPAEEGGTGEYELFYVVFPPGEGSRFGDGGLARPDRLARIDLTGFELFEQSQPDRGRHVTFGARLRSIVYDGARKHWLVRLEPKSGVIITHHEALQASGWPVPESVELPKEDSP